MKELKKIEAVKELIDIFEKWPENDCKTLKTIMVEMLELNYVSEKHAHFILTVLYPHHSCPRKLYGLSWKSNEDMGY